MCGICGYALPGHTPPESLLRDMCVPLARRGPDAEGVYCAPGIGLGHRRLTVLDTVGGAQPMRDPSGRFALICNGEIYNHRSVREDLEALGHVFHTRSDTEVLLHACMQWGQEALARCNGMFALAFWDAAEQRLLLARDRLGVKPLYWARCPRGGLLFASELTAVMAAGRLTGTLHIPALQGYLNLGYVLGEQSIMEGVFRLSPGHALTFRNGETRIRQWWNLADVWRNAPRPERSLEEHREAFQALLDDSVRLRLESDVPLGAFLSGGLDSCAVVAAMRQAAPDVCAFTMAFDDPNFNEGPQAERVARFLGVRHMAAVADAQAQAVLPSIATRLDEPFADTSIIPTYMLCAAAHRRITVALSGDGGDELLAGYVTLHADALFPWLRALPRPLARMLCGAAHLLPDIRGKVSFTYKLKQFLAAYPLKPQDAHAWWRMLFSGEQVARLLPGSAAHVAERLFAPFRAAWAASEGLNMLDRFLYVDYMTWLPDDILFKADRASMRHGLEVRSPFLDYRLVTFCAGLPPECKRRGRHGKILLREATARRVPRDILAAPKRGFNAPVSHWLCGLWRDMAEEAFAQEALESCVIAPELIRRCWKEHASGHRDHGFRLFAVLMYMLWARRQM